MTTKEKDALMEYITSRMIDFCEAIEKENTLNTLYDEMYSVLSDLEITIETNNELTLLVKNT